MTIRDIKTIDDLIWEKEEWIKSVLEDIEAMKQYQHDEGDYITHVMQMMTQHTIDYLTAKFKLDEYGKTR